ncbi:MAG: hypothetical protein OEV26_01815 [Gallionella sp.]|nr:hypothetical protein [Gallionella sp.]MDH4286143.1 hypothetical protein [Gallionella sp.]
MKKIVLMLSLAASLAGMPPLAHADLSGFLKNVNIQAQTDMKNFSIRLSTQFGVPVHNVEAIINRVSAPADAFMVLQLGQMARKEPEAVLQTYQRSQGKGWGAIAKELGIKPGSPEFHALKRGNLSFTGEVGGGAAAQSGGGRGHGKGRGHRNDD